MQSCVKRLNYEIKDMDKRKEIVEDILAEMDDYLNLYFYGDTSDSFLDGLDDKYAREYFEDNGEDKEKNVLFNPHPNCCVAGEIHTGSPLSDGDFACKFLERLSDYLIYDGNETNEEKKQRRFEKDSTTNDTTLHSAGDKLRMDGTAQAQRNLQKVESGEAPDFNGNYKKEIKQKIFKEDIEKSEILKEYHEFRVKIGNKKRSGELPKSKVYKINKILGTLKDDMIYVKDFEFGTIYFKSPLADSGRSKESYVLTDDMTYEYMNYQEKDLLCDFFNQDHYSLILKVLPFADLSDNLKIIRKKFAMLETRLELTEDKARMLEVLKEGKKTRMQSLFLDVKDFRDKRECLTKCKQALYDITSLADKLDWEYNKTRKIFDRLCKDCHSAFIEMFEEEFYYMNIVHGNYKKCSKCGEIKLVQRFDKKSDNKDGYDNRCKKCKKK